MKDYENIFKIQSKLTKILKTACPNIENKSGIYFLTRVEGDEKFAYIGKSVKVLTRMISHLQGYKQQIDNSLTKWGLYSSTNEIGWKLGVIYFPECELDEKERFYIDKYKNAKYELYNIESGGTIGKEIIGERKAPKGYLDGKKQERLNIQREIAHLFDKNLDFSIKGKPNKNKEKAFEKFKEFITIKIDNNAKND